MDFSTSKLGLEGEDQAAAYLQEQGYEIVARNYRYGKGEIDIIANDGDELVFVEVKTRSNDAFGHPVYALTQSKQKQIIRIAKSYVYERDIVDKIIRFDVITIENEDGREVLEHIKDAFIDR